MNTIQAIKIKLSSHYTERPEIGLLDGAGVNSEIRLTESPLAGVDQTWAENLLVEIGDIEQSADFSRGGSSAQINQVQIVISNTEQNSLKFQELHAYLYGQILEIHEFRGTDADSDSVYHKVIFTGSISNQSWTETEFTIEVESSFALRRNKNIIKKSSSLVIPVTFGKSDPTNNRFFKAVETTKVSEKIKVSDISLVQDEAEAYPPTMALFPVYQKISDLVYQVRLGFLSSEALPSGREQYFLGKYALCKEGDTDNEGKFRKIVAVRRESVGQAIIEITFDNYWPNDLAGNYYGTEVGQTWLEFYSAEHIYQFDGSECGGFFDQNEVEVSQGVYVYSKDNDSVLLLPPYGVDTDSTSTSKNSLEARPLHYEKDLETISSFLTLPAVGFSECQGSLLAWDSAGDEGWGTMDGHGNGIYYPYLSTYGIEVIRTGSVNSAIDKNHNTNVQYDTTKTNANSDIVHHCFKFKPPTIPVDCSFSNVYIGIKATFLSDIEVVLQHIGILHRGYINRVKSLPIKSFLGDADHEAIFDTIPDFYYTSSLDTHNKNFYKAKNGFVDGHYTISGYQTFKLTDITNISEYEAIEEFMLYFYYIMNPTAISVNLKISEVCLMFENNGVISKEIFL